MSATSRTVLSIGHFVFFHCCNMVKWRVIKQQIQTYKLSGWIILGKKKTLTHRLQDDVLHYIIFLDCILTLWPRRAVMAGGCKGWAALGSSRVMKGLSLISDPRKRPRLAGPMENPRGLSWIKGCPGKTWIISAHVWGYMSVRVCVRVCACVCVCVMTCPWDCHV